MQAADSDILSIEVRAGGGINRPLATPALAMLARLATRLGILISRPVVLSDGEADREAWVRAEPAAGGVTLAIALGDRRARARISGGRPAVRGFLLAGADWGWETDAALRLTHVALDAGTRLGFDAAGLLGQPLTRLFALDERDGGLPLIDALATREDVADQPARLRPSDRAVRLAAIARLDAAGGFAGFMGATFVVPDVAMKPTSEPGLSAVFAGRLDRALRRPLGQIIANADSINAQADGPLRQDYVDYAADIASAGRHLMGLVDDLADLEAIERADFTIAVETIDLADLGRRAAGLLTVRACDSQVTIARPGADDRVPAMGEFRRALQVLVNLVGNAVRYAPAGSTVHVVAQTDGDQAVLIVADEGKGIAPDDQARIFDKFERVDPGEPGGSGLGLYIARRLARAMGGDLTVDSAPGEGARFVFTLPAG